MNIGEKVAYLKGLAEGLELSSDTKNGKIIKGILDILEDMAASIQTLETETETLDDYITEIDEDLGELEKDFMRSGKHKVLPHHLHKHDHHFGTDDLFDDDDDDEEDDDEEYEEESKIIESTGNNIIDGDLEIKCSKCGEHIFIETDELLDSDYINCPKCGAEITAIDTDDINGCSCGHCHGHNTGSENGDSAVDSIGDDDESAKF